YVPNRYTVRLAPSDYSRFEGLAPTLQKDFSQLLSEAARDRRWKLPGAMVVAFQGDGGVKEGRFEVDALHDPSAQSPETDAAPAKLSRKDGDGRQDWVLEGDEVIVGRQETCDIVIENPNASRRHARLTRREDGWWIADMGAVNGTLVNGSLVKERRLRPGDRIQIGTTELEYQDSGREESG
ncbi:MAG: FhaA domain-containing protein, partial [Actinomycetota bacterium]